MRSPSVVILGGGVAGLVSAYVLGRAGIRCVTVLERSSQPGGLAGSFRRGDRDYPLAYHHIAERDRTLLYIMDRIGALPHVRWRRIHMLFHVGDRFFDLNNLSGFLAFPLSLADKLRFVRMMARSYTKRNWSDWEMRSAAELIDAWGSARIREALFEPLARLKFELPCSELSAAWMGSRLYQREGASPLGYIPGTNWTKVLTDGLRRLAEEEGARIDLDNPVRGLGGQGGRITHVLMEDGTEIAADAVLSTLPTTVYRRIVPEDVTPHIGTIRYSSVISAVCGTRRRVEPEFYWLNLASLDTLACGLFKLNSLNPTIGAADEDCFNFVTHTTRRDHPARSRSDEQLQDDYLGDFRRIFGVELDPEWMRINHMPVYSPVFERGYANPPVRSTSWANVYFAGNYRTFPSIASTGTAIGSGLEAARMLLRDQGRDTDLPEQVTRFKAPAMIHG